MSQKASFLLFSKTEGKKILKFFVEPFKDKKLLQIVVNEEKVYEVKIINKTYIQQKIEVTEGVNKVVFLSKEGCAIPFEIGNECDMRCLSFKISDITIL